MLCIGILWNTVYKFKNQILNQLEEIPEIQVIASIELDLKNNYASFVRSIYINDLIALPTIEYKIDKMLQEKNERKVIVFLLNVDNDNMIYNREKKIYVNTSIDKIKKLVRNDYKNRINNYFFDNIVHMTDNLDELYDIYYVFLKNKEKYFSSPSEKKFFDILTKYL